MIEEKLKKKGWDKQETNARGGFDEDFKNFKFDDQKLKMSQLF